MDELLHGAVKLHRHEPLFQTVFALVLEINATRCPPATLLINSRKDVRVNAAPPCDSLCGHIKINLIITSENLAY